MNGPGVAFVVLVFAAYRVTRLWLWDSIFARLHLKVIGALDGGPIRKWCRDLLTCQWCLGVWVAGAVTATWWTIAGLWSGWQSIGEWLVVSLAVAAGQSLLHLVEDRLQGD